MEHAFGLLKGRFLSLKEMGTHHDIQETYKVIEALMVIHNMCIDHGDRPEQIHDFDPHDDFLGMGPDDLAEVEIFGTHVDGVTQNYTHQTDDWL